MVLARRKAVATQENLVPRSSASEIVGSAVLVTLPSKADSRRGMQMAMKDRQKPAPRVHTCEGVSEGSEGGSFGRVGFLSLEGGGEGEKFGRVGFSSLQEGMGVLSGQDILSSFGSVWDECRRFVGDVDKSNEVLRARHYIRWHSSDR